MKVIFNIIYFSGLRIGETLALTPTNITPYQISIKNSYDSFTDTIGPTKTDSSVRNVAILKFVYNQTVNYIKKLYKIKSNERIFDVKYSNVYCTLISNTKKLNLSRISPHNLRHSYASNLYSNSKDITAVSEQLGHKNPKKTLQVYTHMIPAHKNTTVSDLEKYVENSKLLHLENLNNKNM